MVQSVLMERDGEPLFPAAERASQQFDVRILLFSDNRQVVLDTNANKPALPFPNRKLLGRGNSLVRDETKVVWLYTMERLPDNTWLMVATPRPRVSLANVYADDYLPLIFQSGLVALLLSLVVAFFFARWIADPMQKVVAAARAVPSADAKP